MFEYQMNKRSAQSHEHSAVIRLTMICSAGSNETSIYHKVVHLHGLKQSLWFTGLDKEKFAVYNCKYFLTHNF